jgi:hypothetical protein
VILVQHVYHPVKPSDTHEEKAMKLWDFGRMESGLIKISPKVGEPLGLVDGSEVFSSMFK